LYRLSDIFESKMQRYPGLWKRLAGHAGSHSQGVSTYETGSIYRSVPRAIVISYGPVGRTVTRLLRESEIEPLIVELNLETVRLLRAEGIPAIYGDATQAETMALAGVERAISLILSTAGMPGSREVIRLAREANPRIQVFARSVHLREAAALRQAGADVVFSGEGEVALAMMEFMLRQVGATPEQIDGERDRIRRQFFGFSAASNSAAPKVPASSEGKANSRGS
jgi:CPA2 family monovalent cation:H+ antiporter-2